MSFLAIYIKTPSNFVIINKDYHFLNSSLGYKLTKVGKENNVSKLLICI